MFPTLAGSSISADSERVKVALISMVWEWLEELEKKRLREAVCLQESNDLGSAGSEGVRRTAWRTPMDHEARKNCANVTKKL